MNLTPNSPKEVAAEFRKKPSGKMMSLANPEKTAADMIEAELCPICGKKITSFRDARSEKEYTISGMCQDCQDSVFGG